MFYSLVRVRSYNNHTIVTKINTMYKPNFACATGDCKVRMHRSSNYGVHQLSRRAMLEFTSHREKHETEHKIAKDKDETINEKQAVAMGKATSDSVIVSRPFTRRTSETDAESWLEFFELYCNL